MATISKRRRSDGTIAYFAQIRAYRQGKVAHSESKTFDHITAAREWAKRRESEIAQTEGDLSTLKIRGKRLSVAIERYIDESNRAMGKTKAQVLRSILTYEISAMPCAEIKSTDIVDFARELSLERQPQTVGNYLSHLGAVFAIALPAWGLPLDYAQMQAARLVCARLGMTAKAAKRQRRPSISEMDALMHSFAARSQARPRSAPMHKITAFAMFSTRRQDEVARARWDDVDFGNRRLLVRDMKNPGDKAGNDVWCDLPAPSLEILKALPRTDERIFPVTGQAISAAFSRACKTLEIDALRFHDLRHEGVSRLFEMGLTIPQVAAVSGHRSWSSLQRYSHFAKAEDKWKDWAWITTLT